MEQKNIYATIRIRYNDELKLFPSSKLLTLQDIKLKAISRFDLPFNQSEFDLQYFDWESKGVLALENTFQTTQISPIIMTKLIKQKIQLQIVKKQSKAQKQIPIKSKISQKQMNKSRKIVEQQEFNIQIPQANKILKHYAQCDKCMKFPILGIRYKCIICDDFDLCEVCFKRLEQQKGSKCHPYMKIRNPLEQITSIKVSFKEEDINKLQNCQQRKVMVPQKIQKNYRRVEVDRKNLSDRSQVSRNFMQAIFGRNNPTKKVYKIHPSFCRSDQYPLTIDDCS